VHKHGVVRVKLVGASDVRSCAERRGPLYPSLVAEQ